MLTNSRLWLYFKARLSELSSKFSIIEAAGIAALNAANQVNDHLALMMGVLVFIKFFTPDPKGSSAAQ